MGALCLASPNTPASDSHSGIKPKEGLRGAAWGDREGWTGAQPPALLMPARCTGTSRGEVSSFRGCSGQSAWE